MKTFIIFVFAVLPCLLNAFDGDRQTIKFKVSARALKDKDPFGTSDPYVVVTYAEGDGKKEHDLGRSDTKTDDENPDWSNTFTFEYDRKKNQRWHFVVYDHDNARTDDTLGDVWVTVNDYMDKNQFIQPNLVKKGYLIIQKV